MSPARRRRWMGALLWGAALVCASVAGSACTAQICDRPEPGGPTLFTGGERLGNTYRTSTFDGDLLHFPGGAHYEIEHQLGRVPTGVVFYLAFDRHGLQGGSSVALAAGNQVEVKAKTDTSVTVLNGTCSEFYLIMQAWVEDEPTVGGGGAGGAGGAVGGAGGGGGGSGGGGGA